MDKVSDNRFINISEKIFVTLIFLYAILGSNNITFGNKIITPIMWGTFVLGGILLLYRVFHLKRYIKMTAIVPMIAMVFSIVLSTIVNRQYALKENVVICIYWVLFFFLLYAVGDNASTDRVRKNFEYLGILFAVYIMVGVLVSFWMMHRGISEKISVPEAYYEYYKGFAIGRLWGMFINPNNSAISAAIVIGILIYFIEKKKNVFLRVAFCVGIILMILFIALTDSRTGAVCLGVVLAFYWLIGMLYRGKDKYLTDEESHKEKDNQKTSRNTTLRKVCYNVGVVILTVVIGVAGFALPRKTKDWYNQISTAIAEQRQEKYKEERREELIEEGLSDEEIEAILQEELLKEDLEATTIERGYDLSGDVSNRRIDAWKSATELFVSSPKMFILGASFKGITEYAMENLPETYIVNNNYGRFTTLDNEIFNIMDAQGLMGLLALAALLMALFVGLFKYLFKVKKEDRLIAIALTAIVFGMAASAMFGSVMFYHFSQNTILFWVALGSLMYIVKTSAKDNQVAEEQ